MTRKEKKYIKKNSLSFETIFFYDLDPAYTGPDKFLHG